MYSALQYGLLENFARCSDELLNLGIVRTDSYTGEIAEHIVCSHFNLKKCKKVSKAVDGICEKGIRYQIKSFVNEKHQSITFKRLDASAFDFLAIVQFNLHYEPQSLIILEAKHIKNTECKITKVFLNTCCRIIEKDDIHLPQNEVSAINRFASAYNKLFENEIIRSRKIVGDIGEALACDKLGLKICDQKTQKGYDAIGPNGETFEIKTRRVYESDRRISKRRRLNNLEGKVADYIIVVTLDWEFKCSGMWLIPTNKIVNPESASLTIVNSTPNVTSVVPSSIPWLKNREKFHGLHANHKLQIPNSTEHVIKSKKSANQTSPKRQKKTFTKTATINTPIYAPNYTLPTKGKKGMHSFWWALIILVLLYMLDIIK